MLQAQQTNENQAVNPGQDNLNNQIERNYMINQRQYSYKGPENEEINQLLIILERCAIQDQQMYNKWVEKIRDLLNKVLLKYEKDFNSSYAKFKLEINLQIYDLIVCLVYIILWIIALSNSLDLDNDNIKSSQFKSDISSQLPIYLSLLTFSTLAFQNIQMFSLWVLLFISLVLIPLVVMIYNLSQQIDGEQSNYQSIGFCILSYLIFIISYINKGMTTYLTRIFNQLIGAFYKCGFCLFVMYLLFFKIILLILSEEFDSSENFIEQTITIVAPSAFIIIFAFSILIYRDLFKLSPIQIEMDLGLLANTKQPDYYIRNDLIIRINKIIDDTIKKLNLKQTVPIIIFVSFCFLETFCFGSTLYELKNGDLELSLNFAGFFIMIPLFLFLTIHMLNSGYHPQKLYLYGTLFYVVILGFICLMFQNLLKEIDYFQTIAKMIGMGPLFISLAWSTIGYFRSEKKDYQMLTFGIVFICFAFPLGFLYLLFDSDQLNYSALQAFFWIFICLGLIPILILIIYYVYIIGFYLYDSIQRFQNNNFSTAFKCIDLNNYAQWFNQTFFTIGFYAVCYYVQNEPQLNQSNIKKGVLQGLLIVLIVLFILINKSLVLDKANVSTSYQLEEYSNNCLYYIIYLIILMLLIILPIALTISNKTLSYALLINVICLPIVSYFYYYLILIKKQQFYGNYQNFLIPLIIIFTWIFFIGPFGIIAPVIAVNYESQTKEFSIFAQAFTTYFILLTIFFINIRAIFKSLILNKEQQEMKKQKVLKEIIRKLFSYGVYSNEETCSLIYFKYQNLLPKDLLEGLKGGDPVKLWIYNQDEQENEGQLFSKKLISKSDYDLMIQNDQNEQQTSSSYWDTFLSFLKQILFCQCGRKQLEQDKLNKREQLNLKRIQAIQNSLKISQIELDRVQADKYYVDIVNGLNNKVEDFWLKMHKYFKNDLSIVLDILKLKRNDFVLTQFKSFSLSQKDGFTLSVEDFAQLLLNSLCQQQQQQFYPTLQKHAKNLYPKLLVHKPDFAKTIIQKKLNHPFNNQLKQTKYRLQQLNENEIQEDRIYIDNQIQIQNYTPLIHNFWAFCQSVHNCIWIVPKKLLEKLRNQLFIRNFQSYNKNQKIRFQDTPPWLQLAQEIIDIIKEQTSQFDKDLQQKEQQEYKFYISIPNILQFMIKLFEMMVLSLLAFDQKVGWFGDNQFDINLQIVEYSNSTNYIILIIIALILSFLYILLGLLVSKQIEDNTYGLDENHQIVSFPQIKFFINKALQIISGQFIFIMKTYIDSIICDYSEYPYMLIRKKDLQCFEDLHFLVISLSFFGCIIYYPLQAYLQPIFQYSDYSLDLKYKSNYVVIFTQTKLLILGLSTVFRNIQEKAYQYQMAFVCFVLILLFIFQYKNQPCFVKWFNKIDSCLLIIVFSIYFGGFIMMYFKIFYIGWIVVSAFSVPSVIYIFVVIKENFRNILRRNVNQFNQVHNLENNN